MERADHRWAVVLLVPAYVLYELGDRTGDPVLATWSMVSVIVVPVFGGVALFLSSRLAQRNRKRNAQRRFDAAVARARSVPLGCAGTATEGATRIRGALRRLPGFDAFDARLPEFIVEDETGFVLIDDDSVAFIGLAGTLPPDGTVVEVSGVGWRRQHPSAPPGAPGAPEPFVFEGTPDTPVSILPAA